MLQVNTMPYASDALEDAMRLAQTKALNSYTFSDCLNFLNYAWRDIYDRMAQIDDGYYGINVRLTSQLTKLPVFVKNTIQVYAAQAPVGFDRLVYRESGAADMTAPQTYHVSGTDLWCPDVNHRTVWLYYVPACPQIFFTHHNRDPKIYEDPVDVVRDARYNLYELQGTYVQDGETIYITIPTATREEIAKCTNWLLKHRATGNQEDITEKLKVDETEDGSWQIVYISCDYPYIFVTYEHSITKEHISGFFDRELTLNKYNPFDFTGRNSDVEYIKCHWNDKTGMSVLVKDYNDLDDDGNPKQKELGWTPDTRLNYPAPEMYRYLVARLADKFSALNESDVMGVQKELVEARYAFEAFLDKDKSAWKRINNVNPATLGDWL